MKKFPQNPEIYNPVQLLHQMTPGIQFTERTISATNPSLFEVKCELNQVAFEGQGNNCIYIKLKNKKFCLYLYLYFDCVYFYEENNI